MTTSMLFPEDDLSIRFEKIMNTWYNLSGRMYKIGFNNPVYLSEKKTADRNYALAHFMNETNDDKPIAPAENELEISSTSPII